MSKSTQICTHCCIKPAIKGRLICNGCRQRAMHRARKIIEGMQRGEVYRMYFNNVRETE